MNDLSSRRLEEVISEVTREMSTNTDLDMREFLGIDKALDENQGRARKQRRKIDRNRCTHHRENNKLAEIRDSPDLQVHEERVKANHCRPKRRAELRGWRSFLKTAKSWLLSSRGYGKQSRKFSTRT